ncbi:MAG TPA: hypothetical protein VIJ52_00415 [Pseudolabrys sp.]
MGANVNRCVALAAVFALTLPASVVAQVADDDVCRAITDSGRAGLFIYYPTRDIEKRLIPVGEQTPPLVYETNARFFYLAGTGGRPRIVNNETVWNIKSQTSANSDIRANAIYVNRGAVATSCTKGAILPVYLFPFNYIGLQTYLDHHSDEMRTDFGLRNKFHLPVSRARPSEDCHSTDDPEFVGPLSVQYGFDHLVRSDGSFVRAFSLRRQEPDQTAGYSSELAYVSAGSLACFGFSLPVPTKSTVFTRFVFFLRAAEIAGQLVSWHPNQTLLSINRLPGGRKKRLTIRWQN